MKNLVTNSWLWQHIDDKDIVIADCRFDIYNTKYGKEAYKKNHLKNAIFLEMDKDLSGPPQAHGGARPLPDISKFASKLMLSGISNHTTVIAYDDQIDASARLWWLLKYIGHERIFLLDGGFKGWIAENFPVSCAKPPKRNTGKISIQLNSEMYCDIEYVKTLKDLPNVALIDGREYERFTGKVEKLYKKAGHIPGAICQHYKKNFDKGFLKEKKKLSEMWSLSNRYKEIILYCGSGIAASVNYLVLDELGYSAKLYMGSFSDWISYHQNPVEKGRK